MNTTYTDRLGGAPIAGPLNAEARCRVATTADITIATALNDGDTIDGVVLVAGDLVLVKDQAAPAENGVYAAGDAPARHTPFDRYSAFPGQWFTVQEGTANADTTWLCTSNAGGTIGETALAFANALEPFVSAAEAAQAAAELARDEAELAAASIDVPEPSGAADRALATDGAGGWTFFDLAAAFAARISASLMTTRGDIIYRDASGPQRLAKGSSGQVLTMGADDPGWSTPGGGYPPGHIFGLILSNAADADHDIAVAAGSARSEGDTANLALAAAITKQIDAAWSVGSNAGGLNTGSVANNTWYEVHLIRRSDTGVVDAMFTTTANRASLPANYDSQRRIGWVRTDGSANIRPFTQVEDYFTLTTQINDVGMTPSTTAVAVTLTAPPWSVARFRASAYPGTGEGVMVFSEIAEGNVTPARATGISSLIFTEGDAGAQFAGGAGHFELRVDASSQIEVDSNVSSGSFDISTFGWIDTRGRLA